MFKNLFEKKNIAVVLGGLPGSGKSFIANQFASHGFLIICKDTIRYEMAKKIYGNKPESLFDEELQKMGKYVHPILKDMVESFFAKTNIFSNIDEKIKNKEHNAFAKEYVSSIDYNKYKSIVFDATHFNKPQRKAMIDNINGRMEIYCVYINKSLDESYEGVKRRVASIVEIYNNEEIHGRDVPSSVLEDMKKYESLPKKYEGFKEVYIIENKF